MLPAAAFNIKIDQSECFMIMWNCRNMKPGLLVKTPENDAAGMTSGSHRLAISCGVGT